MLGWPAELQASQEPRPYLLDARKTQDSAEGRVSERRTASREMGQEQGAAAHWVTPLTESLGGDILDLNSNSHHYFRWWPTYLTSLTSKMGTHKNTTLLLGQLSGLNESMSIKHFADCFLQSNA